MGAGSQGGDSTRRNLSALSCDPARLRWAVPACWRREGVQLVGWRLLPMRYQAWPCGGLGRSAGLSAGMVKMTINFSSAYKGDAAAGCCC